jgi:hypothetical protein
MNNHALSGIQTHNLSNQAAANVRLKPHGCWNPLINYEYIHIMHEVLFLTQQLENISTI